MSTRRELIKFGLAACATGVSFAPSQVWASTAPRTLLLQNLHTGEKLEACFWENGRYIADACAALNKVLRDHRSGEAHMMDTGLYDILTAMAVKLDKKASFQIISGYRSPATNAKLSAKSSGVAKKSLHMLGQAMDVRMPGADLARVRDVALSLKKGGVGYYPKSNFVHVDTGRVRQWSGA